MIRALWSGLQDEFDTIQAARFIGEALQGWQVHDEQILRRRRPVWKGWNDSVDVQSNSVIIDHHCQFRSEFESVASGKGVADEYAQRVIQGGLENVLPPRFSALFF